MSSLRHGKIERDISAKIIEAAEIDEHTGKPGTLMVRSDELIDDLYRPDDPRPGYGSDYDWKPPPAVRKAVTRAMRSFVRKHRQYALAGGQGRRNLYLYDTADPLSVAWTKLNVERRQRNPISRSEAESVLAVARAQ